MLAISGGQTNALKTSLDKPALGIIVQSDAQTVSDYTDERDEYWNEFLTRNYG